MPKTISFYSQLIGLFIVLLCPAPSQAQDQAAKRNAKSKQAGAQPKPTRLTGEAPAPDTADTIWHRQPATNWNEAFPFGNGRLGGMMFGKVDHERIQLNEDSMWSGGVTDYYKPNGPAVLKQAQELIFAGNYAAAEKLIQNKFLSVRPPGGTHTYQTLGDLNLKFPIHSPSKQLSPRSGLGSGHCPCAVRSGRHKVSA